MNAGAIDDAGAALLIWFLRYGLGVDELDALDYVFDSKDAQFDGWYVSEALDTDEPDVLLLFEVKASFDRSTRLSARAVEQAAARFKTHLADSDGLFASLGTEGRIASQRNDLDARLREGQLKPALVLLTTGTVPESVRSAGATHNVEIHGHDELTAIARALDRAGLLETTITVDGGPRRRFFSRTAGGRIAICEVAGAAIARWPGIEDRSLFGLNVRHELGTGPVRTELDAALARKSDHANFIAYHNGLTVMCREITENPDGSLEVAGVSVVNGAQSVIALKRNVEDLTDCVRLLVKFVEAGEDRTLAGEVARRSNTQTAVNPRNLRALDGRQQLLASQFESHPEFEYIVRPDERPASGKVIIKNDDAAQWLCALYLGRPWLAVKRTELFRSPSYQLVFDRSITAEHIIFAWRVRQAVQAVRPSVPRAYRSSWRLVAIVAVFLVGEILRDDDGILVASVDPTVLSEQSDRFLSERAAFVGAELRRYHERAETAGFDDFKVAFKNQGALRELANRVLASWRRRGE